MEAILARDLTKNFADVIAVEGLSLSIPEGEIFGLVGPDGAGKTTTMRMLTAILDPSSGDAWVNGNHTVREGERLKEDIGYMSQRFGLYPDLSVLENINFYADIYEVPRRGRKERVEELLSFSNLTPFKDRLAGNLSGGMKQKLGLACVLIHTPKVLFLDEPTNGVDPVSRRDFWRILYRLLKQKVTILFSTAYLDEAERCKRVGLMDKGQLLSVGTPQEIKKRVKGKILEVRTEAPRVAITYLRERFGGRARLFGSRIHIGTENPEQTFADVEAILKETELHQRVLQFVEPSLEDVFITMVEEDEK
jgi:ABC-2 type transport system ATP-binding protein